MVFVEKGSVHILQRRTKQEVSGAVQVLETLTCPCPSARRLQRKPPTWPGGSPLVVWWAHALTLRPAPRADHRCEGCMGSGGPPQARLWASVVLLHGGTRQGQEGRGRLGGGPGGVGSRLPSPWPTLGHRRGEDGPPLLVTTPWVWVQGPPCCSRCPSALAQGGPGGHSGLLLLIAFP